jgi:uncharacterized membrane protein
MKTKVSLFVLFLFIIAVCLAGKIYAQQKWTPEQRAQKMTDMLNKQLSFSDDQYKVVHDIIFDYMSNHTRADFDRDELNGEIEKVLTTDQKDKFEKIKNNMNNNNKRSYRKKFN